MSGRRRSEVDTWGEEWTDVNPCTVLYSLLLVSKYSTGSYVPPFPFMYTAEQIN